MMYIRYYHINKVNTDVNKCCDDGASPLFIACQKGHYKIVKILLTHGVDSNKSRDDGCSPLQIARLKNHIDVVEELLKVQKSHCLYTDLHLY
jgi:ankyrin repeat protein